MVYLFVLRNLVKKCTKIYKAHRAIVLLMNTFCFATFSLPEIITPEFLVEWKVPRNYLSDWNESQLHARKTCAAKESQGKSLSKPTPRLRRQCTKSSVKASIWTKYTHHLGPPKLIPPLSSFETPFMKSPTPVAQIFSTMGLFWLHIMLGH